MRECWVNADGAPVIFDADGSGHVQVQRDAFALILVAAGFHQEEIAK